MPKRFHFGFVEFCYALAAFVLLWTAMLPDADLERIFVDPHLPDRPVRMR